MVKCPRLFPSPSGCLFTPWHSTLSFYFCSLAISNVCCWFSGIPWLFLAFHLLYLQEHFLSGFLALSLFSPLFLLSNPSPLLPFPTHFPAACLTSTRTIYLVSGNLLKMLMSFVVTVGLPIPICMYLYLCVTNSVSNYICTGPDIFAICLECGKFTFGGPFLWAPKVVELQVELLSYCRTIY